MRIGFFTNNYLPIIYGLTTSVESFRHGLEELGHEVYVLAPAYHGYQDRSDKIIRYPSIMFKYKLDFPVAISFYPPITRKIRELKFDVIHSHHPFSIGKDSLRHARQLKLPIVFTHHCRYEDYTHYVPPIIPQSLLKWHVKRQATNFANQCNRAIAPTQTIKELMESRGVTTPIEVLSTGIEWERFQTGDRQRIREELGIAAGETLFLHVGRVEQEKNLEFLLEAAISLLRKNKQGKLLFVGGGSVTAKLQQRSAQAGLTRRVLFSGIIPHEELHHFYSAGDIFLHTSMTETQGMTITEAMAAGLPIVAIRATGVIDQITNRENGIITENDMQDFVRSTKDLLKDRSLQQTLSSSARQEAKKYDYKAKASRLVGIYKEVITQQAKTGKQH